MAYTVDPVDLTTYYGDIWRPDDGGANHPGIVTIHGGHFIQGSRTKLTGDAQTLACAGFVVLNIDYRLTGVELDAYTDAVAAVAYLRPLAHYAGVGAHGVSAGAFLANRLAVEAKADAGSGFSGGGPNEAGLVTPYSKPLYMAHSIDDPNRPIADSEAIRDAYDALPAPGVPHRLDEIPGTAHGNEIWDQHPEVQQTVIDWFRTYLPPSGSPPPPAPTVSKLSPNTGTPPGGTTVTITGTSFTNVLSVKFALGDAASFTVTSPTTITAVSPPHYAGTVDVTVTTTYGTSSTSPSDVFTYASAPPPTPPSVTAVSPASGPTAGGTTVTITGSNFTGATYVRFASLTASSFSVLSDTTITAVSPSRGAGTVDVTVSDAYGTSAKSPADQFTYVPPPLPTVTAVTPASGSTTGGTTVTITGANFTVVTAVRFARLAALSFTVFSSTSITAVSPAHGTGAVDVTVVASGGTSAVSSSDVFTYSSRSRQAVV